jgi:hypothetical protein
VHIENEAQQLIAEMGLARYLPNENSFLLESISDPISPIKLIPIIEIYPIVRAVGVHTFVKERALSILVAIQQNKPLPPVFVDQPSGLKSPYKFMLYDGFHRYHLCKTLGFTHLWAYINPSKE